MADSTNSLSGVGSGIDTTSLISGLVNADSGRLNALKTKQTSTNSAVSTLSDISTTLGSLQSAVDALTTTAGVGSYAGTSSNPRDRDQHDGQRPARLVHDVGDSAGQGAAHVFEHVQLAPAPRSARAVP